MIVTRQLFPVIMAVLVLMGLMATVVSAHLVSLGSTVMQQLQSVMVALVRMVQHVWKIS